MAIDTEALYRTHGPMVLRRCQRMLGSEVEAVDAMHDVFVNVLRFQDRLDAEAPSSLLYRMATNTCLNKIRSRGRRPEDPQSELLTRIATLDDVDAERRAGARGLLARVFGLVPEATRESTRTIAVLLMVDGMTLQEVADEVGMSVSGVRKRMRTLRERVGDLNLEVAA